MVAAAASGCDVVMLADCVYDGPAGDTGASVIGALHEALDDAHVPLAIIAYKRQVRDSTHFFLFITLHTFAHTLLPFYPWVLLRVFTNGLRSASRKGVCAARGHVGTRS